MLGLTQEQEEHGRETEKHRGRERSKAAPAFWLGTKGQWYHNHDNEPGAETGLEGVIVALDIGHLGEYKIIETCKLCKLSAPVSSAEINAIPAVWEGEAGGSETT